MADDTLWRDNLGAAGTGLGRIEVLAFSSQAIIGRVAHPSRFGVLHRTPMQRVPHSSRAFREGWDSRMCATSVLDLLSSTIKAESDQNARRQNRGIGSDSK